MIYIIILIFILIIYYLITSKTINTKLNILNKETFFVCPYGCTHGNCLRNMGKYRFSDDDL